MESPEEKPIIKRELTPEYKAAAAMYIPITTNPIDKFTPDFLKESLPREKWPVVFIRKPGSLDMVESMERTAIEVRKALREHIGDAGDPPVETNPPSENEKAVLSKESIASVGREAIKTWRERVTRFENVTAYDRSELKWEEKDGSITDSCLNMVPWRLLIEVHFRYDSLFSLTELEKEGLESKPVSA